MIFLLQDSDWEEIEADGAEADKDLMHAAGVTSFGQPTHEHLEAIAKIYNKVFSCWLFVHYENCKPWEYILFYL